MKARAWISSTTFSKAYLRVAWESRGSLMEYERRGFAQFFYVVLCGHVECLLSQRIKSRTESLRYFAQLRNLPPEKIKIGETVHSYPVGGLVDSLNLLLSATASDAENAPVARLIEIYSRVFPVKLSEFIGKDLKADLEALAGLRNLFAHGRDVFMEFDGPMLEKGTLDGNPLKQPAQRLYEVGLIKNFEINGRNHNDFHAIFYSDAVLLHFYNAVSLIDEKIRNDSSHAIEHMKWMLPPLPKIN